MNDQTHPIIVGVLVLHFLISGCSSLKEKRGLIKPLIHCLHQEYNLAVIELDRQDMWHETVIGCASISSSRGFLEKLFQGIILFCQDHFRDLSLIDSKIEWM